MKKRLVGFQRIGKITAPIVGVFRRSALAQAVSDEAYQKFLDERLEHGWLRPGGALFRDFAQIMQEQFRGVMLEQISPAEAVETITETYAP